jgi:hypothetical protein
MRSLEKEPEARWPTADALRRALESRSAPPYHPRRASATRGGTRFGAPPPPSLPAPGRPEPPARRSRARAAREAKGQLTASGEPKVVAQFRDRIVTWAGICGGMLVIDLITGGGINFAQWVALPWAAFGILPQYMRLWQAGYSWRDVLHRPAALDGAEARLGLARNVATRPASTDEFGHHAETVRQARNDREGILKIMERVPASERKLLPDVVATVDGLLKRAEDLARMLHGMSADVDEGALARLEDRIDSVKRHEEGTERERQLSLLERQRQALGDLLTRRRRVEEQIESCVMAMQNVRFDLLRLRSAGVAAVLSDLTNATQQARALSRDVDHAIAAAVEIQDVLREGPPLRP